MTGSAFTAGTRLADSIVVQRLFLITALLTACSGTSRTGTTSANRSSGGDAGLTADVRASGGAPGKDGSIGRDTSVGRDGALLDGAPAVTTDGHSVDGATPMALEISDVACQQLVPPDPSQLSCDTPCGNGTIDSCQWTWGHSTQTLFEQCDGPIAPSSSCQTSGYAGGTLACNPHCLFDYAGCTSCQSNPEILQCVERLDLSWSNAIAAGGGRIALGDYPAPGIFRFQQFDESLAPVAEARCWQLGGIGVVQGWTIGRLSAGWLLGAQMTVLGAGNPSYEVQVLQLDESGNIVGAARSWPNADRARMVSRESGGPLMLIYQDSTVRGVLFDSAGAVAWDQALPIDPVAITGPCGNPVFTRDGFLVPQVQASLDIAKFDLDGRLMATHPIASGCPLLAWNGTEARMVWLDDHVGITKTVFLSRLDADGAPLGPPATVLTWTDSSIQPPAALAAGNDTLLFFRDYRAARVDANGALTVQPFPFRKLPSTEMATIDLSTDTLVLSYDTLYRGVGLTRFRR